LLQGISKTVAYLDDVLVQGSDYAECLANVEKVLGRFNSHNVRIQPAKCKWFESSVEYLGHVISKHGRSQSPSLTQAICNAPSPSNLKELRSFLGLINFYSSFLPSASTILKPLRQLTEKSAKFSWSSACENAFQVAKQLLLKSNLLIHYDPTKDIVVHTDASPVGVSCVLNHKISNDDGSVSERPVLFASCSLTPTQQKYSQLDREALAVIFAVTKLKKYLWGRHFTLVTDNQPIRHIFAPGKAIPVLASHRLQHWAAILSGFNYTLEHRKSNFLSVADALSRLPINVNLFEIFYETIPDDLPVNLEAVVEATRADPLLSRIADYTLNGWPNHLNDPSLAAYFKLRFSFSLERNVLLFSNRVVVPQALQKKVLELLHLGHPGVVRTKLLARSLVWWLSLNSDIETMCQSCHPCTLVNFKSVDSRTYPWPAVKAPFERVHVDLFVFKSVTFFLYVDAFSKWMYVAPMPKTDAQSVISELQKIFAFWGLPRKMVSDNGPPFSSQEYKHFCTRLDIILAYSPVSHPESNAQVERSVQIVKKSLKKLCASKPHLSVHQWPKALANFLFAYLNTPTTTNGKSPNQMLLSYLPRTLMTIIHPRLNSSSISPVLPFKEGDHVFLRIGLSPVMKGIVVRALSATRYLCSVEGVYKKCHLNQLSYAPPA